MASYSGCCHRLSQYMSLCMKGSLSSMSASRYPGAAANCLRSKWNFGIICSAMCGFLAGLVRIGCSNNSRTIFCMGSLNWIATLAAVKAISEILQERQWNSGLFLNCLIISSRNSEAWAYGLRLTAKSLATGVRSLSEAYVRVDKSDSGLRSREDLNCVPSLTNQATLLLFPLYPFLHAVVYATYLLNFSRS